MTTNYPKLWSRLEQHVEQSLKPFEFKDIAGIRRCLDAVKYFESDIENLSEIEKGLIRETLTDEWSDLIENENVALSSNNNEKHSGVVSDLGDIGYVMMYALHKGTDAEDYYYFDKKILI